ncbi:hypothetical protein [Duganella sp. HH101]|jgi:hypothetical protein|nr:hypothetical protein [Duganella sp. HH101]
MTVAVRFAQAATPGLHQFNLSSIAVIRDPWLETVLLTAACRKG